MTSMDLIMLYINKATPLDFGYIVYRYAAKQPKRILLANPLEDSETTDSYKLPTFSFYLSCQTWYTSSKHPKHLYMSTENSGSVCVSSRLCPLQSGCALFSQVVPPSVLLCPLQSGCAPFSQVVPPSVRLCPLQSGCAPFSQVVPPSVRLCPCSQVVPLWSGCAPVVRLCPLQSDRCPFSEVVPHFSQVLQTVPAFSD